MPRPDALLLVVALAALTTTTFVRAPASASSPEPFTLAFPLSDAELDGDAAGAVAFINAQGCVASSVSDLERETLERAFEAVRRAFDDPQVRALVAARTRWADAAGAWRRDEAVGPELLRAFASPHARARSVATLVAYDRDGARPCPTIGDEAVNAFARGGSRVIAIHRTFLERAVHAPDPEVGRHILARALAHEVAHVLGYGHTAERAAVTSESYAGTVPVFAGCVALNYPDVDAIRRLCGRAEAGATHTSVACDARARVAALAPGVPVAVRVTTDWVEARVVGVVGDPDITPRVAVDFGLDGVAPRTVDVCRVRASLP